MRKYAILNTIHNEILLSYLGIPYEKTPSGVVFDGDIERDLRRLASAIRALGYAHDDVQALRLAASFFLNEVR
jgi:hypothetical protein